MCGISGIVHSENIGKNLFNSMLGGNIFSKINFSFGVLTVFKHLIEFISK